MSLKFSYCLSILARHLSPVHHYPLIISTFQLLFKLNCPSFSQLKHLCHIYYGPAEYLIPISLHTHNSAFHTHARIRCHICLLTQANQNLSLFFSMTSSVVFPGSSMLRFSLPSCFKVWSFWTFYFSWGFMPSAHTWRISSCVLLPLFLTSKPAIVADISTRHFYFFSACKLKNIRSFSERYWIILIAS